LGNTEEDKTQIMLNFRWTVF